MLAEPGAGEQLARYELVAEIASGGMATVYLARALGIVDFRRFFAVKRLHPHLNKDPDFVAMFVDEARLAARIHHPNVVPIFEIGVKDEQYFLVMDYIEGDTASRLVIRSKHLGRTLPIGFTTRVLVETLAGLHAAHELTSDDGRPLEIVHRDVSPQNILVGVDGVSRITDFGVARAAARIGDQTQGGQLKGKLAYMAPEQIRGGHVDRRVDIFAAGIVLWEMLAGERLFKAETDGETLFKVAAAEVPDLTSRVPELPPAIAAVCHRALAKEPSDRFATAADFGDALESAARAAGMMFTGRESAALVNELVGQEITAHRDLVRTWLTRSDVSRSGVALAQPFSPPPRQVDADTPESGSRATPPPVDAPPVEPAPRQLGNLISDHEELATRLDVDVEAPVDDSMPATPPAPPPSAPLAMPTIPQAPTLPEFMPLGAMAAQPPPSAAQPTPSMAPASGPTPAPSTGGRLPAWVLAIPIALVVLVGGGVLLLKMRGGDAPVPPKTTTTPKATTAETAPTATDTATAIATTTAEPTATATATSLPTATTTTAATATATTKTVPTMGTIKPPATATAAATATASHKPKIDNSAFGGRK